MLDPLVMADHLNLNRMKKYYSILEITTVSKKDLNKLGDKKLAVDNSRLREQVRQQVLLNFELMTSRNQHCSTSVERARSSGGNRTRRSVLDNVSLHFGKHERSELLSGREKFGNTTIRSRRSIKRPSRRADLSK